MSIMANPYQIDFSHLRFISCCVCMYTNTYLHTHIHPVHVRPVWPTYRSLHSCISEQDGKNTVLFHQWIYTDIVSVNLLLLAWPLLVVANEHSWRRHAIEPLTAGFYGQWSLLWVKYTCAAIIKLITSTTTALDAAVSEECHFCNSQPLEMLFIIYTQSEAQRFFSPASHGNQYRSAPITAQWGEVCGKDQLRRANAVAHKHGFAKEPVSSGRSQHLCWENK